MKKLKGVSQALILALVYLAFLLLGILALPLLVVLFVITRINESRAKRAYQAFLRQHEGYYFFCYNNKKKPGVFIENTVIPLLPEQVHLIYLNGRVPESAFPRKHIQRAIYGISNRKGFPYLMKISGGAMQYRSLNAVMYRVWNGHEKAGLLQQEMVSFYNSPVPPVSAGW